jgi:hypothetical protein
MDEKLRAMMERYLAALIKNDPSALPVAAHLRVTENGYPINLGQGLFETATAVTYRHVICDPQAGQVAFSAR